MSSISHSNNQPDRCQNELALCFPDRLARLTNLVKEQGFTPGFFLVYQQLKAIEKEFNGRSLLDAIVQENYSAFKEAFENICNEGFLGSEANILSPALDAEGGINSSKLMEELQVAFSQELPPRIGRDQQRPELVALSLAPETKLFFRLNTIAMQDGFAAALKFLTDEKGIDVTGLKYVLAMGLDFCGLQAFRNEVKLILEKLSDQEKYVLGQRSLSPEDIESLKSVFLG